jgi:DNA polymerase-3 subunit epsilon
MELNLTKPITFFDLETTGVQVGHDHIVEICLHKVMPDGTSDTRVERVRPADADGKTVHIPEQTTAVHGITDADVADKPSFRELAPSLLEYIGDADLAGYNSNKFDVPLLVEEFLRVGIDFDLSKRRLVDVQNIFHQMEQRTLVAAYKFYCQKDLENAHSAAADTIATYEVLKAQLDRYDDLRNEVSFLSDFSSFNNNVDIAGRLVWDRERQHPVVNFGKYKGQQLREVLLKDQGYYGWIMGADFPLDTKRTFTRFYMLYKKG